MLQPGSQVLLQPSDNRLIVPGRISEKPLHPSGRPRNRLRQVLSVAPLPGLYQQGLEIMTAVLPRPPAGKQRSEVSVKIPKGSVHLFESCRIHIPTSPACSLSSYTVILSN